MNVRTDDIILFSIGYLRGRQKEVPSLDKRKLSTALDIKTDTLNKRLSEMRRAKILEKQRIDGVCGHVLTGIGRERYREIHKRIMDLELRPDLHSVSELCRLGDVIEYLSDPYNVVRVAYCVSRSKPLDAVHLIQDDRAMRPGSKENAMINELVLTDGKADRSINDLIEELTLVGKRGPALEDPRSFDSVPYAIISAEMKMRRGSDLEAMAIYGSLLRDRAGLDPAYWIFCIIGIIKCTKVLEGQEKALELVERSLYAVKDPAFRAMLNKNKGDILQDMKRYSESEETYRSVLMALKRLQMPNLKVMVLNNLGVLYFRQGLEDKAKDRWKKARTISVREDLPWVEAICNVNLSDVYARAGQFKNAKELLSKSKQYFLSINDLEGLSGYDFNMALVCVEEGNRDLALHYFSRCEDFPLQYLKKRAERRAVLIERFERRGWEKPFDANI
ncbi:MAG: tetratricopeptide repeat protein [Candidatus Thermoplasmatota archaeon]|nr:tetratricopeptide repeat protein [Candidatus Thermoplasmatota archaeon]